MNSSSSRSRRRTAPSVPRDWPEQLEDWRRLLGDCRLKPTRKRVHLLRVATLRLQAQVLRWLNQYGPEHPDAEIAQRWNKQAKYLRRALGNVRAFDVHLGNLSRLRGILTADSGYQPRSCRTTLRQIDDLEIRFKRKRKDAAKSLLDSLAARYDRIQRATFDLAAALRFQQSLLPALNVHRLSEMFVSAIAAFPRLDPDSLHDFRKRLKSVRYLAELYADSREAIDFAATVKAMQGAIGAWHDWEELGAEASRAARRRIEGENLPELLDTIAQESLEKALALCEKVRDQYLPSAVPDATAALPAKKPVRRAEAPAARKHLMPA